VADDGWCWFVLREKYCWLVADKPSEQGECEGEVLAVLFRVFFLKKVGQRLLLTAENRAPGSARG
jgi:hypothetical protein